MGYRDDYFKENKSNHGWYTCAKCGRNCRKVTAAATVWTIYSVCASIAIAPNRTVCAIPYLIMRVTMPNVHGENFLIDKQRS